MKLKITKTLYGNTKKIKYKGGYISKIEDIDNQLNNK